MPNVSNNIQKTANADKDHKINPTINVSTDINNLAEIPVLAKDSYYLSRLEASWRVQSCLVKKMLANNQIAKRLKKSSPKNARNMTKSKIAHSRWCKRVLIVFPKTYLQN